MMNMSLLHKLVDNNYSVDRWVALLTWALLTAACLYFLAQRPGSPFLSLHWLLTASCFVVFYLGFHVATRDEPLPGEPTTRIVLVAIQFVLVVVLYFLVPYNFVAILMVLWAAQLPYFMPLNKAITASPVIALPHFLVYQIYWQDDLAWLSALLFWTFIIFSMTMMGTQLKEARAKENEQRINRELRATQALLAEATKQTERTRIARNIHDLLGHHLTALTINLQVAEHKSSGEARALIAKSRSIAQLLLADVREAVSTIRESDSMDIAAALEALDVDIAGKTVTINYPSPLNIQHVETAEAILALVQESLTNFMRHSTGNHYQANVTQTDDWIKVNISDNGKMTKPINEGNGIRGLRERVALAGGDIAFTESPTFTISAQFRRMTDND
ncbi:sensor histidine kinase [Idiomarina aquatica]|uniref:Signal transduction histidine kinase subgroup 3 dimerisation and phosphoacceptor domain-containing protein n=1 Tax=Idiomarina aquatica TaxID=1327752 RepID=A0AA94JCN4_9GAMM|nr:histidine kinase [Idiomarina aquatica]RUO40393.1 hypothetical protein CWE23_12390 [Idiomarina aquatica]